MLLHALYTWIGSESGLFLLLSVMYTTQPLDIVRLFSCLAIKLDDSSSCLLELRLISDMARSQKLDL